MNNINTETNERTNENAHKRTVHWNFTDIEIRCAVSIWHLLALADYFPSRFVLYRFCRCC